jgi:DNA-binding XRE family transcriptional regulator
MLFMDKEDLKRWRKRNKYSQEELGKALGVYQVTIARWETGVRKIPPFLDLALQTLARKKRKRR